MSNNVEDAIDDLIDTINGLTDLTAWRSDDDWLVNIKDDNDSFVVVKVIDTGRKDNVSLNNFTGRRENPLYSNYGYMNVFRAYVRVITPIRSDSREHATTIENYLKVNFDNIHSDIVIRRHTFSAQKLFTISTVKVLYGVETSFDFSFANVWNDEPAEDPLSQVNVDEINIDEINQKNINIRVSYEQ